VRCRATPDARKPAERWKRSGPQPDACANLPKNGSGRAWTDQEIAQALDVGTATGERVRRRFVEGGLLDALGRRPQPERPEQRNRDGEREARLVPLAWSQTEGGQQRWTMRMVAEKLVHLG